MLRMLVIFPLQMVIFPLVINRTTLMCWRWNGCAVLGSGDGGKSLRKERKAVPNWRVAGRWRSTPGPRANPLAGGVWWIKMVYSLVKKHTKNYGESQFLMGKSTISTGPLSMVKSMTLRRFYRDLIAAWLMCPFSPETYNLPNPISYMVLVY